MGKKIFRFLRSKLCLSKPMFFYNSECNRVKSVQKTIVSKSDFTIIYIGRHYSAVRQIGLVFCHCLQNINFLETNWERNREINSKTTAYASQKSCDMH